MHLINTIPPFLNTSYANASEMIARFDTTAPCFTSLQSISAEVIRVLKYTETGTEYVLCSNCNPLFLYFSSFDSIYQRANIETKSLTYSKIFTYESIQEKPTRFNHALKAAKKYTKSKREESFKLVFAIFSEADLLHLMHITKRINIQRPGSTIDIELYVEKMPYQLSDFLLKIPFESLVVNYYDGSTKLIL